MELQQTGLQVLLSEKDTENIRTQLIALASSAVDEVKQQASLNSEWLRGKAQARKYLDNLSEGKFNELNAPCHLVNGVYFYNKKELNEFICNNF